MAKNPWEEDEIIDSGKTAVATAPWENDEPVQQPTAESKPAWYDVGGKLKKTINETTSKIEREGELSGQGKLNPVLGGALSMLHAGSGVVRGIGDIASPIVDNPVSKAVVSGLMEGASYTSSRTPNFTKPQPEAKMSPVAEKSIEYLKNNPEVGNRIGSLIDVAGAVPVGKITAPVANAAPKMLGKGLESTGKKFALAEMKITNPVAKKAYGKDLIDKKKNIANDMVEFGITKGNHQTMRADASIKAQERFDKVDEIVEQLASDPSIEMVNPVEVVKRGLDIDKAPYGKRKQVQQIIDNIIADMEEEGLNGPVTIDKLIQAKRNINVDGKTFKSGPALSTDDAIEQAIRKKMYLNIVDQIGEISPEIKALNTEGKRLLDVESALAGASSREANKNAIGLTDWILGGASIANPGTLAATVPIIATKKMLGSGRGSNLLINTGRALQGKSAKTIDETLGKLSAEQKALPKLPVANESSTIDAPEIDLNTPAFMRKGVDLAAVKDKAVSEKAKQLRINNEYIANLQKAENTKKVDALKSAKEADKAKKAQIEQEVYMENLPKSPVIDIERLRALKQAKEIQSSQTLNTAGDIAAWKKLGDNYPLPDRPLSTFGKVKNYLKDQTGAVGGSNANPQVKSDNFKKWFGDWEKAPDKASKVVDESGKPLVLYHGTVNDFNEFSPSGKNKGLLLFGDGSYFSDDAAMASKYANSTNQGGSKIGGNVKPVYLDLKNPITDYDEFAKIRNEKGFINKNEITKELKSRGYDGVMLNHNGDRIYVAFEPTQIKSATGNSGAFSPNNPDIRGNSALGTLALTAGGSLGALTAYGLYKKNKEKQGKK